MEITDVRIFPVDEEKLKGYASIVFDGCFLVNDIKIIQGRDGLFISMPARKRRDGSFKDIAHPLNSQTRRWMEERILGEYEGLVGGRQEKDPAGESAPAAVASSTESGDRDVAAAVADDTDSDGENAQADSGSGPDEDGRIDRILDDSFWLEKGKDGSQGSGSK